MSCKTCPFSLLCCMERAPHLHNSQNIFLCPSCGKVIYSRWCKSTYHVYAFFCEKHKMTPALQKHWKKVKRVFSTQNNVTGKLLSVMECEKCYQLRTGLCSAPYRYTRHEFDNKDQS